MKELRNWESRNRFNNKDKGKDKGKDKDKYKDWGYNNNKSSDKKR
jgi:hypothetical protein